MDRSSRLRIALVASIALHAAPGCVYEDARKDRCLPITGSVTYNGAPVKRGAIHFLPVAPGNLPASGMIADGEIKDVYTREPGDGIIPGRYKVAVSSFDEAFLESVAKRDADGPDPIEVGRAAARIKALIPPRYSNARESGLTADISTGNRALRLELVD